MRRADFRLQLFEDASVDKEVDIRRRVLRDFTKNQEDFDDLRGYNDYLEMVEDIIYNLCNNIDVSATKQRIEDYKDQNRDQINKSRHKVNQDLMELEDIMAEEKKVAEKARKEAEAAEKAEKLLRAQNKEKLIDDLMFSDGDAGSIVADHQSKKDEPAAAVAKFTSGADIAAASRMNVGRSTTTTANAEGKKYVYKPLDFYVEGPDPPSEKDIAAKKFYAHVRTAESRETAAGYTQNMSCLRAIQEAMCGLYFSAEPR